MSIRILLADDHKIIRDGLCSLLEDEGNIEIVAQADNGHTTLELVVEMMPDAVIMDISMPSLNGIEAARRIADECPGTRTIALSMHSDRKFVAEMLKAGASGYVLKNCAFDELAVAIKTVMSGRIYLSPSIADDVAKGDAHDAAGSKSTVFSTLTNREREVLQLLAEGRTTKQIAVKLYISAKTVEAHRSKVMKKLDIDNVPALTKSLCERV